MPKQIQETSEMDKYTGFESENSEVNTWAQQISQDPHICYYWNPDESLAVCIAKVFDLPF